MKDTWVSLALMTPGTTPEWIEQQTGVNIETLKKHYAKWFPGVGKDQLRKIDDFESGLLTPPLTPKRPSGDDEEDEKATRSQ